MAEDDEERMADPYKILGVSPKASVEEIKRAYRRLAKKLHPDLNPGDKKIEAQFKEVTAAYSLLEDAEQRAKYDRGEIDESGQARAARTGPGGYGGAGRRQGRSFGLEDEEDAFAEDLFKDIFGFRRGQKGAMRMRGADVSYQIEVDFVDAALGAKRRIQLTDGKTLDVQIPPGTETGQTLRLKGQGMQGTGGAPNGDAFVEVVVKTHPQFTREGYDVLIEMPISLYEAVLGATITVPTIDGKVALKIPADSNSGTQLRLKGRGIRNPKSDHRGDQYVRLVVSLPKSVDSDLREQIEKSAKRHPYQVR
jgi:DnaJ-class molecular chaperone